MPRQHELHNFTKLVSYTLTHQLQFTDKETEIQKSCETTNIPQK